MAIACCVLVLGAALSGQAFEVQGPARQEGGVWPVTVGVPLMPGVLDSGDLVVSGPGGSRLESSTEVAARWRDGSVRWAWVHTAARLDARGRGRLSLRPLRSRRRRPRSVVQSGQGDRLTWGDDPRVSVAREVGGLMAIDEAVRVRLVIEDVDGRLDQLRDIDHRVAVLRDTLQRVDVAVEGSFEESGLRYRAWITSFGPRQPIQIRTFLFAAKDEVETGRVRLEILGSGADRWCVRRIPRPDRPESGPLPRAHSLDLVAEPRTWQPGQGEHQVLLIGRPGEAACRGDLSAWPPIALPPPGAFGRVFSGERGWKPISRSSSLEVSLSALRRELREARAWTDRGDWPVGERAWGNLEYDTAYGTLAHGIRARRATWVRWADWMLSHLDGIDVARVPPAGVPAGLPFRHGWDHRGPIELGHVWLDGLWAHHWITGDLWCRESAVAMGEGLLEALTSRPSDRNIVRGAGWTLISLAAAWRGTGESRYEAALRLELERVLGWQVPGRGCFDLPREQQAVRPERIEVTTWVQGGVLGEGLARAAWELDDRRARRALAELCEWIASDAWSKRSEAFHVFLAYPRDGSELRRGALLRRRVEAAFLAATLQRGLANGGPRSWSRIVDDARSELEALRPPFEQHSRSGRPISMLLRCAPVLGL